MRRMIAARYGATRFQEQRNERYVSGRDAMLVELGKYGLGERDLVANINFFSKVVVDETGAMQLAAGHCTRRSVRRPALRDGHASCCCTPGRIRWPRRRATRRRPSGCRRVAARRRRADDPCRTRCPENARGFINTERHVSREPDAQRRSTRWCPRANRGWASCGAARRCASSTSRATRRWTRLFYNAADTAEHYSAQNTIQAQGSIYLTTGTVLLSNRGNADAAHRGRHLRPARHAGRRLLRREQHRALRAREAPHAQLPRQFPAGAGAPRAARA